MAASTLIDSLAGRGIKLSIEDARLSVAPASLLTDEDRRLIRRFRKELFALLSARAGTRPGEPGPSTPLPPAMESMVASMLCFRRPGDLARWPISDRQRWGEMANRLEAEGANWREAERHAYETVRGEREAAGRSGDFVLIAEYPTPEPFPAFDSLPGREDLERAWDWGRDFQRADGARCEEVSTRHGPERPHEQFTATLSFEESTVCETAPFVPAAQAASR